MMASTRGKTVSVRLSRSWAKACPRILGTQEAHPEQIDYILSELPQYAVVGHGRFGDGRDKHNKIFFLNDRIQLIDTGDLWFSETPQSPGTASWVSRDREPSSGPCWQMSTAEYWF
jgi:hypothetical protein